jgi:hypothetical protein
MVMDLLSYPLMVYYEKLCLSYLNVGFEFILLPELMKLRYTERHQTHILPEPTAKW